MPNLGLQLNSITSKFVSQGVNFLPSSLPNLWHWFSADFGTFRTDEPTLPTNPSGANQVYRWENKAEIPDDEAAVEIYTSASGSFILRKNQFLREDIENNFGAVSDNVYQYIGAGGAGKVCFKPVANGVWFIANYDSTGGVSFNTVIQSTGGDTTYPWQGTTWNNPPIIAVQKLKAYPAYQTTESNRPIHALRNLNGTNYNALFFQNGQTMSIDNSKVLDSSLSIYVVGAFQAFSSVGAIFGGTRRTFPPPVGVRNGLYVTSAGKLALSKSTIVTSTLDDSTDNGIVFGVINSNGTGTVGKKDSVFFVSENLTGLGTGTHSDTNSYIMGFGPTTNISRGDIFELLVYTTAHTEAEQNQVIAYLNGRYPFLS
jgi:hypothetical protein